jgi:hypothetical protein
MAGDGLHYDGGKDEAESPGEESSEYRQAAEEAFPDEDWTPERVDAFKAFVKLCSGGGDMDDAGASDDKHKATLAMIFGGKPK